MGKDKSKQEKQVAIQKHRDARRDLERISSKSKDVTPEYLAANRRVIAVSKARVLGSPVRTSRSASTRSSASIARFRAANQPISQPIVT